MLMNPGTWVGSAHADLIMIVHNLFTCNGHF